MNLRTLAALTLSSLTLGGLACGGSVVRSDASAGGSDEGGAPLGGAATGGTSVGGAGAGAAGAQGGASVAGAGGAGGAAGGAGGAVGGAGGALTGCEALAPFSLSGATVTPLQGPTWQPGEGLAIEVLVTNDGPDYFDYPGIRVTSSHPSVTGPSTENWFFGMFAGQSEPLAVTFSASADAAPGAVVTFTIEVASLGLMGCEGVATLDVAATLEP
jgi:hypothetical protein